ncbi:MAG: phenylalanine--tRNA ligase subunit beta [Christensenellaceae bacterium]|jgi:phenylalanyl-tRNA synthetase beta chain|nr:phenylalanine--tRNA ligase subunit beta [Christensenellaceae bacterium]
MLVPLKWLKDYVNFDNSPKELAEALISCGFEVENIIDLSEKIKNVVTCKILNIYKHPNADKLKICKVRIDNNEEIQVITAATNIKVGNVVPVALDGAVLPNSKVINAGEIRGVLSEGMFCSGAELGLTEADYEGASADGILILNKTTSIGTDVNKIFGFDDIVLDIAVTANRIDANSIYGIAREVAAVNGKGLKIIVHEYEDLYADESINVSKYIKIENRAPELCPRYMAAVVKDIVITKSPKFIRNRLRAVGIRSINNIVDITNYVLYDMGQPMHAFDLDKIKGRKIIVRRAKDGEKILALDDKEYTLSSNQLTIANSEEPMAIAGVMGGKNYSITDDTKTIVFESANFKRDSIRATSKALGLYSDSSARFGKGIDSFSQRIGIKKALDLINKYKWGTVIDNISDNYPDPEDEYFDIEYRYDDINDILGTDIAHVKIKTTLNKLGITTALKDKPPDICVSSVPDFRPDIVGVNDLAEEVIRFLGYDEVVSNYRAPVRNYKASSLTNKQKAINTLKKELVKNNAYEILTYSFTTPKSFNLLELPIDHEFRNVVKLLNPLGEDFSIMRTSLVHEMMKSISLNHQRNNKDFRLFEIAKTYTPITLEYTAERYKLIVGSINDDFYAIKAIVEDIYDLFNVEVSFEAHKIPFFHPGRSAQIKEKSTGHIIGFIGEISESVGANYNINKKVHLAEIAVYPIIKDCGKEFMFKSVSKYPSIERDLAIIVDSNINASQIISTVKMSGGKYLISCDIFDVYTSEQIGDNKKSIAFNLVFQSNEKTLTDAEINISIDDIILSLSKIGGKLR